MFKRNKILLSLTVLSMVFLFSACSSQNMQTETPSNAELNIEGLNKVNNNINNNQYKYMVNPDNFSDLVSQFSKAKIKTNLGDIEVEFYNEESPNTVNNFLNLAQLGFYDGIKFHRVIEGFMIQSGDPLTKEDDVTIYGTGGPGYSFRDEFNENKIVRGSFAMANSGKDTNGSQFFIVTAESTPDLDGVHTNFGKVVSGMDVVTQIETTETNSRDLPLEDVTILEVELIK